MTKITVTTRDGRERQLDAAIGNSLMEALRDGDVDELLALCGGCCSCATCHVHIDPAQVHLTGPMGADESDLLSGSDHRQENSRLSCQVKITQAMDGLRVTIAPED
ncbi:2Fe-2S iron-sulfur cluster-binding protein [Niveispirillum sp. BGYR6]|uniref:2Fe-2S iron-sulfur cluster-binding protein n=1 Tax=Niveispirillum sp. BGYR6 TaxID=2971249 RepID=UPI0022B9D075|nr:2Fe-2S iron-sulfur cluster-binding protein [Niveispirillum sp. BGYR6]MDG5498027.1 2Fe-2S iron-sulfur cluster-binding protein [Niveispirillum sp. BGYR6]